MNRNTMEHFGAIPKIHQRRSRFDLSHKITTTFDNGQIIPLKVIEVLPGDTFECKMNSVVRMTTPIYPVMDNLITDTYWFFVPTRLLWEHWQNFWGENEDPWAQQQEYEIPQIVAPNDTGWAPHTVADYMGVPTQIPKWECNALPFRAYVKIWNDWFRDENLKYACQMPVNDTKVTGVNEFGYGESYVNAQYKGGYPLKAAKTADYFTTALPSPQKGPAVSIPLGQAAPVVTQSTMHTTPSKAPVLYNMYDLYGEPMTGAAMPDEANHSIYKYGGSGATIGESLINQGVEERVHQADGYGIPNNLYADLNNATAATINSLRQAFAIQKYYERLSAGGSRYIEWLRAVFGVESSDARLQRSEYLGGSRSRVNMSQIIQTSSTDATSPQGHASGFSCTIDGANMFTKSFEEHGFLMCMVVTRIESHTYQQGAERMWTRKKWTDFYNPYFAFLGEQPIYNEQIYTQGPDALNPVTGKAYDKEVFGYQEAWADYRYIPNTVTGEIRSNYSQSLDAWTYADDYDTMPVLSGDWIDEGVAEVDRTIAVNHNNANQFKGDFFVDLKATRCMPVYSVPGLIDHV